MLTLTCQPIFAWQKSNGGTTLLRRLPLVLGQDCRAYELGYTRIGHMFAFGFAFLLGQLLYIQLEEHLSR